MIGGIILAAGKSSRMGSPKSLLPWDGDALINYQIKCLSQSSVSEITVVLGYQANLIFRQIITSIPSKIVINHKFSYGKTTSIKAGLRAISNGVSEILLIGVDQPRSPTLLKNIIREHIESGALITQPVFHGKGGHPLIFNSKLFPELLTLDESKSGVREVIKIHSGQLNQVVVEDQSVILDLNTPEEVAIAQTIFKLSESK
jgi:molybdenum cofactor cytidylyltransferase